MLALKQLLNSKDKSLTHPLFLAAYLNRIEVTQMLLKHGSNPKQTAHPINKANVLHICAERGFEELAAIFVENCP